jgi:hypothetical protein
MITRPEVSRETGALLLVIFIATGVAVAGARPYAGSWNDGSRLATVESLVDHGTLVIDDSMFVAVPPRGDPDLRSPYRGTVVDKGTLDKLAIGGHFYSDKSPVPALLLAVFYQCLQWLFGLKVSLDPEAFCWCMTVASSGLAYVVAAICIFRMGQVVELPLAWRLIVTCSFGLTTVAVLYVQHVNNHILLLGVAAVLILQAARLREAAPWWRLLLLGGLAGFGYAIDLGAGPPLVACTGLFVAWTCWRAEQPGRAEQRKLPGLPSLAACGWFAAGALPWLALHHAVNFAVGGTLRPANAVAEYFDWEGSPFHGAALTGSWHHDSFVDFGVYAAALLFGKRGFVGHNLALFLFLPAAARALCEVRGAKSKQSFSDLATRPSPLMPRPSNAAHVPVLIFGAAWCFATWLLYAATSRNSSGACCSIRWFVPLLAPAYYGLSVVLARWPRYRLDFCLLSAWGLVLMGIAWWYGPWMAHLVPGFWLIQIAALAGWAWLCKEKVKSKRAKVQLPYLYRWPFTSLKLTLDR